MLKAMVVGVGSMGRNHARVYRELPGVELVAVVDASEEAASRVGRSLGVPFYSSVADSLESCEPDLVSLAAPTSEHHRLASLLMGRGIHVLVEKPIASSLDEANDLVALAKKTKVVLAVGHIERFNPAVRELRKRLSEDQLGKIYQIHAERLSPYPARIHDCGVVMDLASHDIDLITQLVPSMPYRLYGETLSSINTDREDLFNGLIRFQSGTLGVLNVNWTTPRKVRRLTLTGAKGMFTCDLLSQELFFYENAALTSDWDELSVLSGVSEGNVLGIRIPRSEPLRAELADFVSAVQNQGAAAVSGEDGAATLKYALQFISSAQTHQVTDLLDPPKQV